MMSHDVICLIYLSALPLEKLSIILKFIFVRWEFNDSFPTLYTGLEIRPTILDAHLRAPKRFNSRARIKMMVPKN